MLHPCFQTQRDVDLLWNVCRMTSACFFFFLPCGTVCLSSAWARSSWSHSAVASLAAVACLTLSVFLWAGFWSENTWTQSSRVAHCPPELPAQLRENAHVHLLSVEVLFFFFFFFSLFKATVSFDGKRKRTIWQNISSSLLNYWSLLHLLDFKTHY